VNNGVGLRLFRVMVTIRAFEETAAELVTSGKLWGFMHASVGQEAVPAGVCDVLSENDYIASTHRGHGHCIAKGGDLYRMMAELYGAADGYCKGRSGSMHIADPEQGILGANGIVGAGLPIALGAAYSAQVRRTSGVSVAFFGEGAVGEGVFHETLNLAALWRLPLVLVCENNQYAELSHVSTHLASTSVAQFGQGYGMPAEIVDGNRVDVVREHAAAAVERARAGGGPTLLEFETYRWRGHFEGDPQRYRTAEEVASWREKDPIVLWRAELERTGVPRARIEEVADNAARSVAAAAEKAATAAAATRESVTADVCPVGVRQP
jgi:acetoin:2,6-dichlorophenolindophenol oxidoreductase subunit alpha